MIRKGKFLAFLFSLCLTVSMIGPIESSAADTSGEQMAAESEMTDENPQRLEEVTGMDEDGDIYEVTDAGGEVKEGLFSFFTRASSPKVVNFAINGNSVTEYTEVGTGASGYTNGAYGADAAYLGTSNGKVRFMLAGVIGEVDASKVQVADYSSAKSISCYQVTNGRLIHNITSNIASSGYATSLDNGPAPGYLSGGRTYYSYDGHYFYTDYSVMLDDYQNSTCSQSVNAGNPYYNYFQYLPLRSETSYSADTLNALINSKVITSSKMRNTGAYFYNNGNTYGVNPLIMAGVAASESGWGTSSICKSKNNLFGLNAVDTSPGTSASTYSSVSDCIGQFAKYWMSKGYLNPTDWRYMGGFLGNKASGLNVKYASDPYWGEKIANICWTLDQKGGSLDAGKYSLGIKDTFAAFHTNVNVRSGSSTSATRLYTTGSASNYSVILLNTTPENGFYRIQSDALINSGRTGCDTSTGYYDYANMYAYIYADYVMINNTGTASVPEPEEPAEPEPEEPAEPEPEEPAEPEPEEPAEPEPEEPVEPEEPEPVTVVTSVAINPSQVEMTTGESRTFGILVEGEGSNLSQEVTWSVENASSEHTQIDETGKLTIAEDETAGTLIVRAASVLDSSKTAEATVIVKQNEVSAPEQDENGETEEPDDNNSSDQPIQVVDDETGIFVRGMISETCELYVDAVASDTEEYASYIEPVKSNTILGVFEIGMSYDLSEGQTVELGFPVDEEYEGQKIIILHYNTPNESGETYLETYEPEIKDGLAQIEVNSFSPYVLALDDAPPVDEADPGDNDQNPPDDTDDSGDQVQNPSGDTDDSGDDVQNPSDDAGSNDDNQSDVPADEGNVQPGTSEENNDQLTSGGDETVDTADTTVTDISEGSGNETLSNGSDAQTVSKESDTTKAEVQVNSQTNRAAKTGDENQLTLWVILLIVSIAGIGFVTRRRIKQ